MKISDRDLLATDAFADLEPIDIFNGIYPNTSEGAPEVDIFKLPKAARTYAMFGTAMSGTILDTWRIFGLDPSVEKGFENFNTLVKEPDPKREISRVRMAIILCQYGPNLKDRMPKVGDGKQEPIEKFLKWEEKVLRTVDKGTLLQVSQIGMGINSLATRFFEEKFLQGSK